MAYGIWFGFPAIYIYSLYIFIYYYYYLFFKVECGKKKSCSPIPYSFSSDIYMYAICPNITSFKYVC